MHVIAAHPVQYQVVTLAGFTLIGSRILTTASSGDRNHQYGQQRITAGHTQ